MELQPSAQFPSQKENFVNTTKRLLENWTFRVVRSLAWKLEFFSGILSVVVTYVTGILVQETEGPTRPFPSLRILSL